MNKPLSPSFADSQDLTSVWPDTGLNSGDLIEVLCDGEVLGTRHVDATFSRSTLALRIKRAIVPHGTIPINFALAPIEIPGHTGPLPGCEWGINIAAAEENFPHDGLQLYIANWDDMRQGDKVSIWLDQIQMVTEKLIRDTEVGQRATLFVRPERLTPGKHEIHYRITRVGGSPEDSSAQAIYVKLDRPGGKDQNGDIPGHSELVFSIPQEIIDGGVGKEEAEKGVVVTIGKVGVPYPNAAEGDEVRVSWGGIFVRHPLTADEAAGTTPVTVKVEKDTIDEAGDSESLALTYEVYDVVQNRSEDWAAEIRIAVDVAQSRIDSPTIDETDYDEATGRQSIDLSKHSTITAGIYVPPSGSNFAIGDQVAMRLKGTTANGEPLDITYPPQDVIRLGYFLKINLDFYDVQKLATSQAIFSFEVIKKSGGPNLKSKGLFVAIIGELQQLAAPSVTEAVGNVIEPTLPRATVMIPWDDSMKAGMVLEPKWLGTRPDTSTYLPDLGFHPISGAEQTAKQPIPFTVDGMHIREIDGGKLELYYLLFTDTSRKAPASRESLHTPQFSVGEPRGELPAPAVTEAQQGALNPDLPNATVVVPNYLLKAVRDEVHITWEGSVTGLHEDYTVVSSFTLDKPLPFSIDKAHIKGNEGGTVKCAYYVKRANNGGTANSDFIELTVGEPAAGELEAPLIALIEDGILDPGKVPAEGVLTAIPRWPGIQVGDGLSVTWTLEGNDNPVESIDRSISGNDLIGAEPIKRIFKKTTADASNEKDVVVRYNVEPLGKRS